MTFCFSSYSSIHGFLDTVSTYFHMFFRTVINVVLNIWNPWSRVYINLIQSSHQNILFLWPSCLPLLWKHPNPWYSDSPVALSGFVVSSIMTKNINGIFSETRFIFVVMKDPEIIVNQHKLIHKYADQCKAVVETLLSPWRCRYIKTSFMKTGE